MLRPPPPSRKLSNSKHSSQSSSSLSPPPPYVDNNDFSFDKPLKDIDTSDPIRATAMILGVQLDSDSEPSPSITERIAEKSREELASLFLEAEKVIRARETELVLAANLGKTLLETNQALKLRYDALLARLPVSVTSGSASNSRASPVKVDASYTSDADQWTTDEEVTVRIPSPMRSRANSSATLDAFSPTHQRRISASPAALVTLQETNNELITELTRLRSETDVAQVEGARRLRKLEHEIKGLKAELETTQRTNAELEARMHSHGGSEHHTREKRLKPLKRPELTGHDDDTHHSQQDFAPPPELQKKLRRASSIDIYADDIEPNCPNYEESVIDSPFSPVSADEYAVVSQLYRKVEELQAANRELAARNRTTKEQLFRAERNSLELKKVYDAIRVELGSDADTDEAPSSSSDDENGSVRGGGSRFVTPRTSMGSIGHRITRSNGKNEFVLSRKNSKATASEKQVDADRAMTLTGSCKARTIGNKNMLNATRLAKNRKPLPTSFRPQSAQLPRSLPCSRSSSPIQTESSIVMTPRSQTPTGPPRGKRSTIRHSPVTVQRTLSSELADKLNSTYFGNPSSNIDATPDFIDADGPCIVALNDEDLPAVAELRRLLDEDEFLNDFSATTSVPAKPSIVLNSPGISRVTGIDTRLHLRYPFVDSFNSSPTVAQRRISRREGALKRMVSTRENEFLSAADSAAHFMLRDASVEGNGGEGQDQHSSASSTPRKGVLRQLRRHSEEIMLELWIYLQFIVILGFFLYTMYKRGPRDVMGLPPRR